MDEGQHFFLSAAGESLELAKPRECWEVKRMRDAVRTDYMLISMEPPYRDAQRIGYRDVYKLVIATRFDGYSLYPIYFVALPCLRVLGLRTKTLVRRWKSGLVRFAMWHGLFQTLAEAEAHAKEFT
jgi:hypothetical protein